MALMPSLYNKKPLWQFTDEQASFRVVSPEDTSRLYFPLANESGILSSITPDLHGDIKTSHNSFLTLPVSIEDIRNTRSSRNFWIRVSAEGRIRQSCLAEKDRQIPILLYLEMYQLFIHQSGVSLQERRSRDAELP